MLLLCEYVCVVYSIIVNGCIQSPSQSCFLIVTRREFISVVPVTVDCSTQFGMCLSSAKLRHCSFSDPLFEILSVTAIFSENLCQRLFEFL
jgi:hypothetical protein